MSTAEWVAFISSALLAVVPWVYFGVVKMAKVEAKVEELSEFKDHISKFLMERAMNEALETKLASRNSPMVPTPETRVLYAPILSDLRKFYADVGKGLAEYDLFVEIYKRFGDWLLVNVCHPMRLTAGACVASAMLLAKEEPCETTQGMKAIDEE